MNSIRHGRGIGDGAGATGERKKPRLKSLDDSNSEVQPDPNSLLVIRDDGTFHAVKFLAAKELCQSEMTCKALPMFAAPILNRLVDDMNKKCDHLSMGKGSRTKLIRYNAAKKLADQVKNGLSDHLSRHPNHSTTLEAKCRGCDSSSFPPKIDNQIFYTNSSGYEIFLSCYEMGGGDLKFQGFIPMRSTAEKDSKDGNLTLYTFAPGSNWNESDGFYVCQGKDSCCVVARRGYQGCTMGKIQGHCYLAALNKQTCRAHFLGADTDFTNHDYFDRNGAVAFGKAEILCNVHVDSHTIAKGIHIARTCIGIVNKDMFKGDMSIEVCFWGDEEDHIGIL